MLRIKITAKALLPVALLSGVLLFSSFTAVKSLEGLSGSADLLLEHDVAGADAIQETAITLTRFGTIAYRLVSETRMDAMDKLEKEMKSIDTAVGTQLKDIAAAFPEQAQTLDEAMASFKTAQKATEKVLDMAFASQQDKALKISSEEVEPALNAALAKIDVVVEALDQKVDSGRQGIRAQADAARTLTISVSVIGCILAVLIAAAILQLGIVRPITRLSETMRRYANGDFSTDVAGRERRDEIGAMARSVEVFKANGLAMEDLKAREAAAAASLASEQQRALDELASSFEGSVRSVVSAVTETADRLGSGSGAMSRIASETSGRVDVMASSTDLTAAKVQGVASATEELAASIADIARQVQEASAVSDQAAGEAERTRSVVTALAERAQRIGEVIGLINEIASQTNLLALNATIEAARAGEAGKGFAVVASEVKNLATQTGKATDEIAAQIGAVQQATREAVTAIGEIVSTIGRISGISASIAGAVEQQSGATGEIARNVDAVSRSADELRQTIAGVRSAAAETGATAGDVRDAAGSLSAQSGHLAAAVDDFVKRIRGAA